MDATVSNGSPAKSRDDRAVPAPTAQPKAAPGRVVPFPHGERWKHRPSTAATGTCCTRTVSTVGCTAICPASRVPCRPRRCSSPTSTGSRTSGSRRRSRWNWRARPGARPIARAVPAAELRQGRALVHRAAAPGPPLQPSGLAHVPVQRDRAVVPAAAAVVAQRHHRGPRRHEAPRGHRRCSSRGSCWTSISPSNFLWTNPRGARSDLRVAAGCNLWVGWQNWLAEFERSGADGHRPVCDAFRRRATTVARDAGPGGVPQPADRADPVRADDADGARPSRC